MYSALVIVGPPESRREGLHVSERDGRDKPGHDRKAQHRVGTREGMAKEPWLFGLRFGGQWFKPAAPYGRRHS
jgi:hypothetical protein